MMVTFDMGGMSVGDVALPGAVLLIWLIFNPNMEK